MFDSSTCTLYYKINISDCIKYFHGYTTDKIKTVFLNFDYFRVV